MPTEVFDIDVENSQNIDAVGYKPTLGVFKKEGIPIGADCTVLLTATTEDDMTECGGMGTYENIPAPPENGQLSITLNCITAARYGGLRVDGTFNRCMEFQQIIVSPLTAEVGPGVITTDIWCYDADGDDGTASVLFLKADGYDPNDQTTWVSCSPDPFPGPNIFAPQPYNTDCNSITPPITTSDGSDGEPNLVAPSSRIPLSCAEQAKCLVVVRVSDDNFGASPDGAGGIVFDPYGCNGRYPDGRFDYNAYSENPVECQGYAVCGNGDTEPGETCDISDVNNSGPLFGSGVDSDGNAWSGWCGTDCELFDPCDRTDEAPANGVCTGIGDTDCEFYDCDFGGGSSETGTCSVDNTTNEGEACPDPDGASGNEDWECQTDNGDLVCLAPPLCTGNAECEVEFPATACASAGTCDPTTGCQAGTAVDPPPATCTDPSRPGLTGSCGGTAGAPTGVCEFEGACVDDDTDFEFASDFQDAVTICATEANAGGPPIDECLQNDYGVSVECSQCFTPFFTCVLTTCVTQCVIPPGSADDPLCIQCVTDNCVPPVVDCTGVPVAP